MEEAREGGTFCFFVEAAFRGAAVEDEGAERRRFFGGASSYVLSSSSSLSSAGGRIVRLRFLGAARLLAGRGRAGGEEERSFEAEEAGGATAARESCLARRVCWRSLKREEESPAVKLAGEGGRLSGDEGMAEATAGKSFTPEELSRRRGGGALSERGAEAGATEGKVCFPGRLMGPGSGGGIKRGEGVLSGILFGAMKPAWSPLGGLRVAP
jgi:hypothetical protein